MRPLLVAWLASKGMPAWLAPDYAIMVGLAATAMALTAMRFARRDGADLAVEALALALAYVGALAGGYVFEGLRAVPEAVAARSLEPVLTVGRAAWGGLAFGALLPALYLRAKGQRAGPFLDRVSVGTGVTFALVRTGCFLEGCDWGVPTTARWGVRFPPGSFPAEDHALRAWVPPGAPSLPVHASQLYEAAVGALGACVAWAAMRGRRARDGSVFAAFVAVYALGRFGVELVRGDEARGRYGGLSTAQWVSLAALVVAARWLRRARTADDATLPATPRA